MPGTDLEQCGSSSDEDKADLYFVGETTIMEEFVEQDPNERREIRMQQRELLYDMKKRGAELITGDTSLLEEKLDCTNTIFKKVKQSRETALDGLLVAHIAHVGKEKVQQFATDLNVFKSVEFIEKLITYTGVNRDQVSRENYKLSKEDCVNLGASCQQYLKRAPSLHFMYGSFHRDEPERKQRERAPKMAPDRDLKEATAPKQVKSFQEMEKQEATTVEVEKILKRLRQIFARNGQCPICYFEFVVNPTSFGQTVENMFYVSFLVRDGYCRIFLDEDKLPVIEPVDRPEGEVGAQPDLPQQQLVMSMNMEEWRDIIDTFNIKEPLIPTRSSFKGK